MNSSVSVPPRADFIHTTVRVYTLRLYGYFVNYNPLCRLQWVYGSTCMHRILGVTNDMIRFMCEHTPTLDCRGCNRISFIIGKSDHVICKLTLSSQPRSVNLIVYFWREIDNLSSVRGHLHNGTVQI